MNDEGYMDVALDLAKSVQGQTSPNPPVGAVIVKDGSIVGIGAHLQAGSAHAEVHALEMAGDKAYNASIYVTLEPCSHYGKTPPCADAIIKSGIKRVIIATVDRNPKVAGKGIEKLQKANITVDTGVGNEKAEELYGPFFHYAASQTPYVTLKSATSLDGKTATITGESKWITGEKARLDVHHYRHENDAILVGVNTVIADDPKLTTRLPNGGRNPLRIILDTHLRTPQEAKMVTDGEAETWIFVANGVSQDKINFFTTNTDARVIQLETETIEIDPVLRYLGREGIMTLYVEGGSGVNGSFLNAKVVQQVITYMAPKLIGGEDAPTSFAGSGIESLKEALQLSIKSVEMLGDDIKIISVPKEVI
ncbi:bifunctional diaminohydroxyphosphoribosylaminopyrimidine deaminase/5-amino-6-(5-phosphoribosylamino)uracil reductase RibD [Virgibacillus necropolis]|uniref:Riboflavin biosynthesis protein RibD n=1 Tax=Virgibacillus necropolis TaxID=163877 RepID=A0A221MGZ0_9BACI|nr:bifunctional diaminohydroxyphosphoribosylaminopyrimidine deaminase/5-amino-6-(5-phosphoribosylamino)uracil reductase RibD [Virgibacillus necropolis]ASN06933.1 riboflavin biosynthesis protein RibD [Virgibacillus necropolis]